ncbi:hypothetical protein AgCh_032099 [Apium graveolens]
MARPGRGEASSSRAQEGAGMGNAQYRRLSRRMDAMYETQSRFAQELTLALGTAFRGLGANIQWPVFGEDSAYPPPDTPPTEGDDDDDSDVYAFQGISCISEEESSRISLGMCSPLREEKNGQITAKKQSKPGNFPKKADPNLEHPSDAQIYSITHKREEGREYKSNTEQIKEKLEKIQKLMEEGKEAETNAVASDGKAHAPNWLLGRTELSLSRRQLRPQLNSKCKS